MYRSLLESCQQLQQEMTSVAAQWQECEKRIDDYVDEQVYTVKLYRSLSTSVHRLKRTTEQQVAVFAAPF